jgi:phytoene dehydrogenase-like protein
MDAPPTFRERVGHIRGRGLTAKINLALSALPEFAAFAGDPLPLGGRILIAPTLDYLERAFDDAKYGRMSEAPWLEISVPSVLDASLVPNGGHVMSIYAQCAPASLRDSSWTDEERDALFGRVMAVIEPHAPALASLVLSREVITASDLDIHWGMPGGHMFHGETTIDQYWIGRPVLGWARYATPIEGLFLASAGTHPGGGLTGLPGLHAARVVGAHLRAQERAAKKR